MSWNKLFDRSALLLSALLVSFAVSCAAESVITVTSQAASDLIEIKVDTGGKHTLEIDDSASFKTPVLQRPFLGTSLILRGNEVGLIPGITYLARIDRGASTYPLKLSVPPLSEPAINCGTLQATWRETGRFYVGRAYSQLVWDEKAHAWHPVLPAVPIGESIYNVEFFLRPAISAARACKDPGTLDEIALYYVAMLDRTETLQALLNRPSVTQESKERMSSSPLQDRTFVASFGASQFGEGELYNSQWLHPAALLMRLISGLPGRDRTPGMQLFAVKLTPFIVREQLLRFFFEQQMPLLGGRSNRGRVAHWELAMQGLKGRAHWDTAMSDIDLWLLSSAAEMLGAQANDPQLVQLSPEDLAGLHKAVDTGIRFFQSKRTFYPDTINFHGEKVGSTSYFNGDYDGLGEMRGTAVTSEAFPAGDQASARPGASWDVAHMYRVAVFMRALYENRKATQSTFPQYQDIKLLVDQYLYKVFQGNLAQPLFNNNFDGSNGWFRVGYNGPDSGQPPAQFCDMHNVKRLCMAPGNIFAWAELSFVNDDLQHLQSSLIQIALDENSANKAFCDRYYFWISSFGLIMSEGIKVYGGAFYDIAAENADRIAPN